MVIVNLYHDDVSISTSRGNWSSGRAPKMTSLTMSLSSCSVLPSSYGTTSCTTTLSFCSPACTGNMAVEGITAWELQMVMGSTGTLAFMAILKTPPLNGSSLPDLLLWPSGKAMMGVPVERYLTPALNVASWDLLSSLLMSTWSPPVSCCPIRGTLVSSPFAMNLKGPSRAVQITGMSSQLAWFATMRQPPSTTSALALFTISGYESVIASHDLDQILPTVS
mmetsp:Transcript_3639/g.6910  ORF Transcript_3639/g.6910 Transcript_3639/m.6910 type:complete len:222 (-) Transcript_3639:391-1056(-)